MGLLTRTLLVIAGCLAVLVGVQVPGFVDQYVKRVDARLAEAELLYQPFVDLAGRRHGGSVDTLIAHHLQSDDPTFHEEGEIIAGMRDRVQYLSQHAQALDVPLHRQLAYLARHSDPALVNETRADYTFAIQLDKSSLASAAVALVAVLIPLELLGALFRLARPRRTHTP